MATSGFGDWVDRFARYLRLWPEAAVGDALNHRWGPGWQDLRRNIKNSGPDTWPPWARDLRDAKMNQIGEGTSEIHKGLIGRHALQQAAALPQHPCLDMDPDLFCGDEAEA